MTGAEWRAMFAHPQPWIIIISSCCLQYASWFYITWLPSYLGQTYKLSLQSTGLYAMLPFIAAALGTLLGGRISDMVLRAGAARLRARGGTVAVSALLISVALLATAYARDANTAVALLTFGLFAYGVAQGPSWALAAEVTTTSRMVASVGALGNFGALGGAFAPIVTGILLDRMGWFFVALVAAALLTIVTAIGYGLLLRRKMSV